MLRAGQLALFADAHFGGQGLVLAAGLAHGFLGDVALEQALDVADAGFQLVDRAGLFEGFSAAEVVGLLALAWVGIAWDLFLAGGVYVVGGAFGGHDCGCCCEVFVLRCTVRVSLGSLSSSP